MIYLHCDEFFLQRMDYKLQIKIVSYYEIYKSTVVLRKLSNLAYTNFAFVQFPQLLSSSLIQNNITILFKCYSVTIIFCYIFSDIYIRFMYRRFADNSINERAECCNKPNVYPKQRSNTHGAVSLFRKKLICRALSVIRDAETLPRHVRFIFF